MLIDGKWTAGRGTTFPTYNPATGAVIAQVPEATAADVDEAVEAAARAFESPEWADMLPSARARLMLRLADLVDENAEELSRLETTDQGQPLYVSGGSVAGMAEHIRYYAGWATKIHGVTASPSIPDVDFKTRREPLGVCALIVPWNFPLPIAAWKFAPALAAGNTVVLKPAEQTPLSALRLGELVVEAGFPTGVVNIITGGPETGQALVRHPKVAKISFTGSTEVGREIAAEAGRSLKRVSLELGGKAPSIIAADAEVDDILQGNLLGGVFNSGQICAALTRYYVDRRRADEFTEKLAGAAAGMKLGSGLERDTNLGPLVSAEQLERVDGFVRTGKEEGAQLVTGGERADGELSDGYFYRPTVFAGVTQDMVIAREEIFGPVMSVLPYDDPEELVDKANDTEYGLTAYIWSRDIGTANRLARRIRAGSVYINTFPILDPAAPWGGMKSSGLGREMGWEAITAYTEVKSIWTKL
jgi:acyl-CoA reductase-like NAD-dependent aldehyde dehydrogenase